MEIKERCACNGPGCPDCTHELYTAIRYRVTMGVAPSLRRMAPGSVIDVSAHQEIERIKPFIPAWVIVKVGQRASHGPTFLWLNNREQCNVIKECIKALTYSVDHGTEYP